MNFVKYDLSGPGELPRDLIMKIGCGVGKAIIKKYEYKTSRLTPVVVTKEEIMSLAIYNAFIIKYDASRPKNESKSYVYQGSYMRTIDELKRNDKILCRERPVSLVSPVFAELGFDHISGKGNSSVINGTEEEQRLMFAAVNKVLLESDERVRLILEVKMGYTKTKNLKEDFGVSTARIAQIFNNFKIRCQEEYLRHLHGGVDIKRQRALYELLDKQPDEWKMPLRRYFVDGHSDRSVSSEFGISRDRIRKKISVFKCHLYPAVIAEV